MDSNLKIYTPIECNIVYIQVFLKKIETLKSKVLILKKKKKKTRLHVARPTFEVFAQRIAKASSGSIVR
jgi:hypothetical protein